MDHVRVEGGMGRLMLYGSARGGRSEKKTRAVLEPTTLKNGRSGGKKTMKET